MEWKVDMDEYNENEKENISLGILYVKKKKENIGILLFK